MHIPFHRHQRPNIVWAILLAATFLLTNSLLAAPKKYPYDIISTIGMVNDIVRQVAGDKANCRNLIGEGVDPHLYKATRNDVASLLKADVVFYSGLMLEGKMSDALVKVARSKPVYAVTELVDESYLLEPEGADGHFDPHLWMDVKGWMKATQAVEQALVEFDPANKAAYAANTSAYLKELTKLDAYVKQVLGSVPDSSRVLLTAHDAFNYFGRAYKIEVMGVQGISTESEAGIRDINRLIDVLVKRDIRAVFIETSVPDKNIRALIEGANARNHKVIVGGALFSDAMGKAGSYEGTYIGMIDHNATTVARALGGKAPEKGMNGKLTPGSVKH